MNHVTLSGTVFEPESRIAKSGMAVLTFRLSYYQGKGKDGKKYYKHRLIADDIGKQLDLFADVKPNGQYIQDEEVPF